MRVDPVAPAVTLTQVLNRYSYTGNDPVNAFDPDGRVTVCNVIASGPLFLSMGGVLPAPLPPPSLSVLHDPMCTDV